MDAYNASPGILALEDDPLWAVYEETRNAIQDARPADHGGDAGQSPRCQGRGAQVRRDRRTGGLSGCRLGVRSGERSAAPAWGSGVTTDMGAGDGSPPAAAAWEAHCRLAETLIALTAIERKRKDQSQDLELGIEALAAVVALINADPKCHATNSAGPLQRLQAALHDLQRGTNPALALIPEPNGRLIGTNSDAVRGMLAAVAHLLIGARIPNNEAGRLVAQHANARGVQVTGLQSPLITAKAVLRWRSESHNSKIGSIQASLSGNSGRCRSLFRSHGMHPRPEHSNGCAE